MELRKDWSSPTTQEGYLQALEAYDAAICEAIAVSQAQANRIAEPNVGYATKVFAQMCGHGTNIVRAAPHSRWVKSDSFNWHFGAIAPNARAVLEGYLLYEYLMEPPSGEPELKARINVMHLNDCTRRLELMTDIGAAQNELDSLAQTQEMLRKRLRGNTFFVGLPQQSQKGCLSGKWLMIQSRDEALPKAGFERGHFNAIFDLLSQHTHILPLSFYRMEPDGRGSGIENRTDRSYIGLAFNICASVLTSAADRLQEVFPDVAHVRRGISSPFSPGPRLNVEAREADKRRKQAAEPSPLSRSISAALKPDPDKAV
jgi:hypothetical protein